MVRDPRTRLFVFRGCGQTSKAVYVAWSKMAFAVSEKLCMFYAFVSLFISLFIRTVNADAVSWNYKSGDYGGPENWYVNFPECKGVMQSPIDVRSQDVVFDPNLELFDFSDYNKTDGVIMTLENVGGHTAEVLYTGTPVYLDAGGLPDKYKLEQFHFHWGALDDNGSEHLFNGKHYPMEAHFVHRQNRLANVTVAAPHPFGLAVVAVFFKVGAENPKYNQLLKYFDRISDADTSTSIPTFAAIDLFPASTRYDYFRYSGSLTTPPCYESVIWSILTDPIEISEDQLNKFRSLYDEEHKNLVNDFRPTQPINERSILTTHLMYKPSGDAATHKPHFVAVLFGFVILLL